jgi:4-azaleucine resistance transporter AzlC
MRATTPLILGSIPFGIIFGALGVGSGLTPAATIGMSLFVFAGSAQFIAVGLAAQGSAVAFIVLTTFVVNLRHALYSASLAPFMKHLPHRWLLPLGFWLTDETYAVVITRYAQADGSPYKHWYHLGSALFMYVGWQLWTLIGIVAGQQPGLAELGLDVAMSVTFIGIVVPLLVNRPMVICALVAGVTALLTYSLPNKMGLIVAAVAAIAAGVAMEVAMSPRRAHPPAVAGERETSA